MKTAKVLYLDKKAKNKEFRVEKFEIYEISKNLNFDESEVNELIEELSQEGSVIKNKLMFQIYLPKGNYDTIKNEFSSKRYDPLGMEHILRLIIGAIIAWIIIVSSLDYKEILTDLSTKTDKIFIYLLLLVIGIFVIGYLANEIYIRILLKNVTIRDIAVKIKPLVFTGIVIWIITLIPFGCMYYWSDEQNRVYALIYLVVTIPTTILASVGVQNYLARKIKNGKK